MNPLQRTALAYAEREWAVLVLPPRSKKPPGTAWQHRRLTPAQLTDILARGDHNLSLLTGPPSRGLGDIDLDTPEARWLAQHARWLPATAATFGRQGAPQSHRLYVVPDGPDRAPPGSTRHQSKRAGPQTPAVHCELRWGPGLQTVVPGSVHPSGEPVLWMPDAADDGTDRYADARPAPWDVPPPAVAAWAELARGAGRLAAGSLLARAWPRLAQERCRHHATNALAGGLVRAGWTAAAIGGFLEPVLELAGDEELPDRRGAIEATAATLAAGGRATGWKDLATHLPSSDVDQLKRWLYVGPAPQDPELQALVAVTAPSRNGRASAGAGPAPPPPAPPPASGPARTTPAAGPPSVEVELVDDDVRGAAEEVLRGVRLANAPEPVLFAYGGVLARLVALPAAAAGQLGPGGGLAVQLLTTPPLLLHQLARMVGFVRARGQRLVAATPGTTLLQHLLATPTAEWGVPALARLVDTPVYAADGRLLWRDGYDPLSGIAVALAAELRGLSVPAAPTRADADAALAVLTGDVWRHFPFRAPADAANALACALTPLLRMRVDGPTPLFAVVSSTPGTGKSLLARSLAHPFVGDRLAEFTPLFGSREEPELRKQVTSYLAQGIGGVLFDNAKGTVSGGTLEGALTRRRWTDRLLGGNVTGDFPIAVLWLLTANNPEFTFESARRTVPVFLRPVAEDPTLRPDIAPDRQGESWLRAQRKRAVESLLTLCRWAQAQPPGDYRGAVLGGYEGWSRAVGAVLAAAGVPDFLANLDDFRAQWATEDGGWRDFVAAWQAKHGAAPVTAEQLWTTVAVFGDYLDDLAEHGKEPAKSLGRLLLHRTGRIYAGQRITRSPARVHGRWTWSLTPP